MKLFYSPEYVAAEYAFDTTRKARWIAESLQHMPMAGVELVSPMPVSEAQLCGIHDPAYVIAVRIGEPRTLAESQDFRWDPMLWTAVCASTGGAIAAVRAALSEGVAGSLSSGLHHAKRDRGDGYCTFNGLALAALDALAQGANRVLILDFDAHCGGGTHALVRDNSCILHIDIAVSTYDEYAPANANRLELVQEAPRYIPAVNEMLAYVEQAGTHDLCIYNAGMDAHEDSAEGGLTGITRAILAERERLVFAWCARRQCRVVFMPAGGYVSPRLTQDELVALHRLTIASASALSTA
jgi:acetoin utilization deacetylase AcuC-like enzyme